MSKKQIKKQLVYYGRKLVEKNLVGGAGGNISVRWRNIAYLSPSGYALDELEVNQLSAVDIDSGNTVGPGINKPTSEVLMHIACYQVREDIRAVVHTHSPWASGIASSGISFKPMFPEIVADLDSIGTLEYILPTTQKLADAAAEKIKDHNALLMANHGVVTVGVNLKEAYYRSVVIEEAAKSLVAASVVGRPRFLLDEEIEQIKKLPAVKHRKEVVQERKKIKKC